MSEVGKRTDVLVVYDLGSGMLRRPENLNVDSEPTVAEALAEGADLVTFSGDKLLGGPQAGIIAGKASLIKRLAKAPIMRALRPGKITLKALEIAISQYLDDETLIASNPIFKMIAQTPEDILEKTKLCQGMLKKKNINCEIVESVGQIGGGSLPDMKLDGYGLKLILDSKVSKKQEKKQYEDIFDRLMNSDNPIVAILREGHIVFDMRTVDESFYTTFCDSLEKTYNEWKESLK
jgi:L-seryl-tRNA(Ser) seleniumtransferase